MEPTGRTACGKPAGRAGTATGTILSAWRRTGSPCGLTTRFLQVGSTKRVVQSVVSMRNQTILAIRFPQSASSFGGQLTKIALFADVQNIYYTTRQAFARQFDYRKLMDRVSAQGEVVIANAYAIDRGDEKQRRFQEALRNIGFTVKLKPYIQRRDGSAKGDWDVGIAIDVMDAARTVDAVVLLSGDGDFDLLLDRIRSDYGVTADVYGVPDLTANSLIEAASTWHAIDRTLLI